MFNIKNYASDNIKNDILSGLVVAVALVPEAIAFSFIAGVSPIVGLYTAFILGLITALIGGKPGMVSGATGAVAIVFVGLAIKASEQLSDAGVSGSALSEGVLQYILYASIIAGLIQISIGLLKLGKFIRLVPQPALYGFVNGLAIVIASAQFKFFEGSNSNMYIIVVATMAIMYFLPKFTKAIPGGLLAIVSITLAVLYLKIDTLTIGTLNSIAQFADMPNLSEFKGQLPSFSVPEALFSVDAFFLVLPYSILVALVGLIESLLTLSVLDEMSGTRGSGNKECIAQGIGNTTCGFFGGMAGCAMIGQSIINYTSGGLGRLSSFTAAIVLILLVSIFTDIINMIPIGVLVGIMFMVSIGTFEWGSISRIKHMPRSDAIVLILVTVITIMFDLAVAVISGVIISALVFAWNHARIYARESMEEDGTKVYELEGPLFFGSTKNFMDIFNIENDSPKIVIDFKNARVMDISGVETIDSLIKKYEESGRSILLRHLSKDCKAILKNAGPYCSFEEDDPTYKVAYNY